MERTCDVVVVGLGPGGEHAATKLAEAGLEVVGIDQRLVGGECPYFGCVPTKMMVAAANTLRGAHRAGELAGSATARPDWTPVADRIRDEATDDWDDKVAVERLEKAGVSFVRGHGRIAGAGRVEVDDATYVARKGIVLNTGTEPSAPPIEGLDSVEFWTNRDVVRLTELPDSLIVIGGGPIGCELAQVFATFGVQVSVIEVAQSLIAVEEPEASKVLTETFEELGIEVLTGKDVQRVSRDEDGFKVEVGGRRITGSRLLVATGRSNNLGDIGLESVGLDPEAKVLETDERMRAADGVWAIGDITGKGAFTHMSMYQAAVAVGDVLGNDAPLADYRAVPRVTFTEPEVASVGLSEEAARENGINVKVATGDLGARGWIAKEPGLVKLVADADRGVLVGGCVVGPSGGEVLSMLVTAIHAEVPVRTLTGMLFAYPTYHRAVETVLNELV